MCGIAGIVGTSARRHRGAVERMVEALRHRGPDDSGIFECDDCVLGHTRLSIIDLAGGAQPMRSARGPVTVTFNGEIYGYRPIRETLTDYPFRTASDTEVILALYERHRSGLLDHLPGMFAFGLWDDGRHSFLAARDRFGEKPFYYAFGPGGELVFASEIKAILASGLVRPVLSRRSLVHYLQYLYVDAPRTIYANVHSLPPAHMLELRDGRPRVRRYWSLPAPDAGIDGREAVGEFRRLFGQAVARCLVADVPVGVFLSGGLDSSTIVVAASRRGTRVKTFSFGFAGADSELPFARQVADRHQTHHLEIDDIRIDVAELLVVLQDVYDEPFADSSSIPTYLISQLARQEAKVVLSGDGADELLGGYSWWYRPLLQPASAPDTDFAGLAGSPLARRHQRQRRYYGDRELASLGLAADPIDGKVAGLESNTIDDALRMDLQDYLPGDILVKTDRASMACGLELRAPFLDVDFASFCAALPPALKITGRQDKAILREAFEDDWPATLRGRGKQGFGAPVREWLLRPAVQALKCRYLNNARQAVFSVLPFEATRDIASRDDYKTWILLVLALWMERYPCGIEPSA